MGQNLDNIKTSIIEISKKNPLVTIVVVILLLLGLVWLGSVVWDGIYAAQASRQVEKYKQESETAQKQAEAYRQEADKQKSEADQYKGVAAAYKQQNDVLLKEREDLLNERPQLQSKTAAATKKVEEIRNQKIQPIDQNIRQRVDDVSSQLDQLYPDR